MIKIVKNKNAIGYVKWLAAACVTWVAVAACSERRTAPTQPAAGIGSAASLTSIPGDVPDNDTNYVATPAGLYHRSCVHEIPNGSHVRGDTIVLPSGQINVLPHCAFPHRRFGPSPNQPPNPGVDGWILDARNTLNGTTNSWRSISANWTVPNAPPTSYSTGQVWYTFPGIQNSSGILQPVLAYNWDGTKHWQIGDWFCGASCPHTTLYTVATGHSISGSITSSNCSGGNCDFQVTVTDVTTGGTRQATWNTGDSGWLLTNALEAYDMNSCDDYPQSQVAYSSITASDRNGAFTASSWTRWPGSAYMSGCGTDFVSTASSVTFRNVYFSLAISGPISVNTGESCYYSAIPNGGYAPPGNYYWDVDGTILSGQNTGAITAAFTDGVHAVTLGGTDGQGNSTSRTIYVDAESVGHRGCER
jgi:hypothetical protein